MWRFQIFMFMIYIRFTKLNTFKLPFTQTCKLVPVFQKKTELANLCSGWFFADNFEWQKMLQFFAGCFYPVKSIDALSLIWKIISALFQCLLYLLIFSQMHFTNIYLNICDKMSEHVK